MISAATKLRAEGDVEPPRIDHLAIKVKDLEATQGVLAALGMRCCGVRHFPEVGLRIGFMEAANIKIELLEVLDESSPVAQDPEGLHHVALATSELTGLRSWLQSNVPESAPTEPRLGAEGEIFFFQLGGDHGARWEAVSRAGERAKR